MKDLKMTIYTMNDCDWWIGESLEACKADYVATTGDPDGIADDAFQLSEEDLDQLTFVDCDEDEVPTGVTRSFRAQLAIEVAAGGPFPRMFASTQW